MFKSVVEKMLSQSELEAIAKALADTSEGLTGSEIGHLLATLKISDPMPTMTKWKRLHNAFVERQNQVFLTKFSKLCRLTNNLIRLADPFQSLPHQFLVAYITSTDGQKRHEPPTMLWRATAADGSVRTF